MTCTPSALVWFIQLQHGMAVEAAASTAIEHSEWMRELRTSTEWEFAP